MTKTIDGLTVRNSSNGRKISGARVARSQAGLRRRTARDSVQARQMTTRKQVKVARNTALGKTTKSPKKQNTHKQRKDQADLDFVAPVDTFMQKKKEEKQEQNAADWSKLLDDLNQEKELGIVDSVKNTDLEEEWFSEEDLKQNKRSKQKKVDSDQTNDKKPRKKWSRKKKISVTIAALFMILVGIIYFWGDALISRLTGGRSGIFETIVGLVSDTEPFLTDQKGRTNILVFGTEGYDMAGTVDGGEHDGSQLTDSIMVVSLDQKTKDVALISLPRDLKVRGACYAGKVNEVYMCNNDDGTNEEAGAKALQESVGEVLGIDFQYYAHVNWASLIDIIDAIGGITVTLDEDIRDYGYTGIVGLAGETIALNGEKALGLARARHGTVGGDFTRGNSQQKIVMAIIQKIMSNGVDFVSGVNLLNILGNNLRTDISSNYIRTGIKFLSGFSVDNIRQVSLANYDTNEYYVTSAMINNISYVVPVGGQNNYAIIQEYIAQQLNSDPAIREGAEIAIYNATGVSGIAGNERDKLQEQGLKIVQIGDAGIGSCGERYCLYDLGGEKNGTRAILEEKYNTVMRSSADLPTEIYSAGADFVIIIGQVEES